MRWLFFLLALLWGAAASAEGGPGSGAGRAAWAAERALPPTALQSIQEAFGKAPPWKLKSARIETSRVAAVGCTSDASCFDLTLSDPQQGCAGHVAGPWCLVWSGARPPAADLLEASLATTTAAIWIDPVGTDGEPSITPVSAAAPSALAAWLLCLLLTLGPLLAGGAAGTLLRRWRLPALFLVVLPLLSPLYLFKRVPVGIWDLGWIGLFFAVGYLLGLFRPPWRGIVLAGSVLLIGLIAIEVFARLRTREPATYPSPASAHFIYRPAQADAACYAIDKGRQPPWLEWRRNGRIRPGTRVLHLGDSMVFGTRVEGQEAFVNELERLEPGVAHVNFGVPYSSTDAQYVVLMTWIDQVKPARVVLHFYSGNDIQEMDRLYPCCGGDPFLKYEGGQAVAHCTSPQWRFNGMTLLENAPPPYVLRLLTSFSWAARQSMDSFEQASHFLAGYLLMDVPQEETEPAWDHLEIILRSLQRDLQARGVEFRIVILPDRMLAESPHPEQELTWHIQERALQLAQKLGIPAIDPLPMLREAVAKEGSPKIYVTPPAYEIHFNAEGHRRYAAWLHEHLPPIERRP